MATPPMLRSSQPLRGPAVVRPDVISAISVLLLGVCAAGMLVAAVLAVYDYSTPSGEAPLVLALALIFGAAVALNVLAAGARHLRRRRH